MNAVLEIINYILLIIIPVGIYFFVIKKYFKTEPPKKVQKEDKEKVIVAVEDKEKMANEKTLKESQTEMNAYGWKYNI